MAREQQPAQFVIDLRDHPYPLGEALRLHRRDHELLDRELVPGVFPSFEDKAEGNREEVLLLRCAERREMLVQLLACFQGEEPRRGQTDPEQRIRAELRLVRGAVEPEEQLVELLLVRQLGRRKLLLHRHDVGAGLPHPLPVEARVAVAQLERLVLAC